jgi:hypothetical protein
MNFLAEPPPGLVANSEMTEQQLETGAEFVDELIALGVLQIPLEPLLNSFPLFLVEKVVQEQWRCIADGKSGGQNDVCSSDPVHLGSPDDILPFLYTGGFSAVIDISKFFHMFPTVPSRMLADTCPLSHGVARRNDFLCRLAGEPFDSRLGTGRVEINKDGKPVCKSWIHVDDIKIHGQSKDDVGGALNHTMDLALRLGLICQPAKTSPPASIQKFCGFIYDTSGIPTRRVPASKISRALALLSFVRRELSGPLARLGLSIVTGVLQSLVPATPSNIGSNFLSSLYADLHRGMDPNLRGHKSAYYDHVEVSGLSLDEMDWWFSALQAGLARKSQASDADVFSLHFGDGSGTGTGGTGVFYDRPQPQDRESWMGTWTLQSTGETSNWKELRTLVKVLRQ